MLKKTVVIGLLGSTLDRAAARGDRWSSWRPSIGICQQSDLRVDRFELLYDSRGEHLLEQIQRDLRQVSPQTEVVPHPVRFEDPWDFEEVFAELHGFATSYPFDPEREDYLLHITTGTHVAQICLFLLAESRHLPGKLLQSSPIRADRKARRKDPRLVAGEVRIIDLDLSRYDKLAARFSAEQLDSYTFLKSGIDTQDERFNALIEHIEQVALVSAAPMLLMGPTGAGKTQLAKRIFELKQHRQLVNGEFVEVNCATLRGDHSLSTLFGHVKGAFTGAETNRAGLLKSADRGILFLDEIGELGLDEQAMLLRAVEEKSFFPLGGDTPVASDFQLIAGTNRDLLSEVYAGRFREDLLARINLWTFRLPGLAQRRADIEPNLDYELRAFASTTGQKVTMNKDARYRFLEFALDDSSTWQGNFRDLNAAIIRMATLARHGRINVQDVEQEIQRLRISWEGTPNVRSLSVDAWESMAADELSCFLPSDRIRQTDSFDQIPLAYVLKVCRSSRTMSAAGRQLFQVSRTKKQVANDADRLRKYLAKYGLAWDDLTGD